MAHDTAMLGIPFDPAQLFYTDDRDLIVWLRALVDRVIKTRRNG